MEHPIWHNIHSQFMLNGVSYDLEDLREIGYSLVKEGESFEISMGNFILDWTSNNATVEVFTSGSTGKPKRITLKKEYMVNSAKATGEYFQLKPNDSALLCLPCSGIAGKMMLVRAMVLGLHLDYVEPSSTPLVEGDKTYDFAAMVPLQVQNSLARLNKVKTLIIGGAPADSNLRAELSKLSIQAFETYGMTETITHIAVKHIRDNSNHCFETLPNVHLTVDDRSCLVIDAPQISNEKIVTNDLVELVDKNQFKWLGRFDSIINSGGIKLIPEEIEKKLSNVIHPRFFVTGIPDEVLGQKLVLILEEDLGDEAKLLQSIKELSGIQKYEVPKRIYFLKSFMETPTKKIDRKKTLELIT